MVVRNNNPALNSKRNLGVNNNNISQNLEKLSSGLRINRAADDAAGLAISEKMRGQINGLAMAEMNVDHGIKLVRTAEGGMEEIINMIHRQHELMVQASNGTYTDSDCEKIQTEIEQLNAEITDMAHKTHFNNIPLLTNPLGREDFGRLFGPTLNSGVINPKGVLNYFEVDDDSPGATPNQFGFNTRVEIKNSAGNPIGLTYDPVTGEKGLAEVDGVNWIKDDVIEFSLVFEVNVDPLSGKWWTAPSTYDTIPDKMIPNQPYTPAFLNAPPIVTPAPETGYISNIRWEADVPAAIVYPDIVIRSPGYPTEKGSFEVVWEGSKGLPANLKCSVCGGSPSCTCGAIPDGFKDRIIIDPNPTTNFPTPLTSVQLKISIDGDFIHIGDNGDESLSGGLNNRTLEHYDGLWDVKVINNSPQPPNPDLNSGFITYNAYQTYNNILPTHFLWPASASQPAPPDPASYPTGAGGTYNINSYYNVKFGAGWPGDTNAYTFEAIAFSQDINLSALSNSHHIDSVTSTYRTTHHQFSVSGGRSYLDLAVDRPERSLSIQSGANSNEQIDLTLYDTRAFALGLSDFWGSSLISATTVEDANASIELLDNALIMMLGYRATAGAEHNRLEHAHNNLGTIKENLTSSESNIRDLDMAKEVMGFTKNQILSQSAQTMLAQAQQLPQGILSLLK